MENLAKLISLPTRGSPAGWIVVLFGLLVTQLVLGKKGAFPYGVLLGINLYLLSAIVIFADLISMIFVDQILDNTSRNFNRLKIIRSRSKKLQEWLKESSWGKKLQHLGKAGVVGITATPFAGGVWSGVTLSHILVFPRNVTFWFVGIGSVIGCGIFLKQRRQLN